MVHRSHEASINAFLAEPIRVLLSGRVAELRFPEKKVCVQ